MAELDDKQKFWIGASAVGFATVVYFLMKPTEGYYDKWMNDDLNSVLPDLDPKIDDEQLQDIAVNVKEMLIEEARQEHQPAEVEDDSAEEVASDVA